MNITVKYYNLFQEALGVKNEVYQLEKDANLARLIQKIIEKHGSKARELLYKEADILAPYIRFFIDNKLVYDLSQVLSDGVEVAVFYAVVGG
jgi:molybdopterin converting factor small subunit